MTESSDPISLAGGSIGDGLCTDPAPKLSGKLCGDGNNICGVCCITVTGCYFGDGSNLTGVASVPGCFSGDCTIIGCNAGGNVAGGATKVVLYGANAGYNLTTGDNIVIIGTDAALCMTTATDSVFLGTSTARCVLTCAGNVAVGAWAFFNECAGTYNTVVGNCAGYTQKGATTNTFVGALAGALDSTGSGNVFIGYKAGCANTTGSCCLVIGNGTCDLITGDFNTASIGLNASIYSTLTVGVDDTGYDVKLFGASAGAFMLYDASADTLDIRGATAAGPGVLKLTTGELTNVDGGILGRLEFQAPLDSAGTDAILVAASIWAEADGTFAAACNKTDLVFATATSETAAEKMRITSTGVVKFNNAYCFPTADGSADQVLCTDGSGALKFVDLSGSPWSTSGCFITTPSGCFVGISTTAPEELLHVFGGDSGATAVNYKDIVVENSGNAGISILAGTTSCSAINFGDSGDADIGYVNYNHTCNMMSFAVNGGIAVTIANNKKVGIGTAAPSQPLHVLHATDNTIAKFESGDATSAVIIQDNGSTNEGNKIVVVSDAMSLYTAGNEAMSIDADGAVTKPLLPWFQVWHNSGYPLTPRTGDGTNYNVCFNCTICDAGSNWNGKCFIAPVAGVYNFSMLVRFTGLTSDMKFTYNTIFTSNVSHLVYGGAWERSSTDSTGGGTGIYTAHVAVAATYMDAADVAKVMANVFDGTKAVSFSPGNYATNFQGSLLG